MEHKINHKQRRFIEEYLVDLNATQAAIRAGYSERSAVVIGCRLLIKDNIAAELQKLRQKISEKTELTVDRVLLEYKRLALLDIRKAFDKEGNLKPIHEWDDDTAAAIAGVEAEDIYEGTGENRAITGRLHKVKLSDKRAALDSIGRHLGMFIDKSEISGPNGRPIELATKYELSDEQLLQIASSHDNTG